MTLPQLYELRARASVLAFFAREYRASTRYPLEPHMEAVLAIMEREAEPMLTLLTAEVNRHEAASVPTARCERCLQACPASQVRQVVQWSHSAEAVCVACLDNERMEQLAMADGAHEGRTVDDLCERAAGRED